MAEKTSEEMRAAVDKALDPDRQKYAGMTYEEGIRDALEWASGDAPDEEFEYAD